MMRSTLKIWLLLAAAALLFLHVRPLCPEPAYFRLPLPGPMLTAGPAVPGALLVGTSCLGVS